MPKKLKKIFFRYAPMLAGVFLVVVVAAVFRARSIVRNAGTEGIEIPSGSFIRYVWLEIKQAFKFSRY